MRHEYKYLIPDSVLPKFRNDLIPFLEHDKHAAKKENKGYLVRSIYFDNRKLEYYHEKVEGIKVRRKVRIRGYNYTEGKNLIFLEIKKKYENYIYKNRSPLNYEDLDTLFETGDVERFINEKYANEKSIDDGKRFFYHYINKSLRPVILVVYNREAFACRFDDRLRITFDKDLRYHPFPSLNDLFLDNNLDKALPNETIIEIKFKHSIPVWLQNIINKYELKRQSVSKYVICLDCYSDHNPINDNIRSAFSNHFFLDINTSEQGIIKNAS